MSAPTTGLGRTLRGARVLHTDRASGNLSTLAGEGHELGSARRDALREELALTALYAGAQEHGTHINVIAAPDFVPPPADGQATAMRQVGVMVLAADCLAVSLASDDAVAVVHAGWRGLAAGVLEAGVRTLHGLSSGPIEALVGPAAGVCCYEVGVEVFEALGEEPSSDGHVDLRAHAHTRLTAAGVIAVHDIDRCTICDPRYFSHRREGPLAGRQGVVAWLT